MSPFVPRPRDICCLHCRKYIFPGANHTEDLVRLVLWALLSVKPHDTRDCFQCLRTASGAESGLRLPHWWPALFPVRHSKREKKKNKRKKCLLAQGPYLPLPVPQGQPHYTVVRSEVIQYKAETKPLFLKNTTVQSNREKREQFQKNSIKRPMEAVRWDMSERQHYEAQRQTHTLFFHTGPCRWWDFWKVQAEVDEVSLGVFAGLVWDRRARLTQMQTGGTVRITSCEHNFPVIEDRGWSQEDAPHKACRQTQTFTCEGYFFISIKADIGLYFNPQGQYNHKFVRSLKAHPSAPASFVHRHAESYVQKLWVRPDMNQRVRQLIIVLPTSHINRLISFKQLYQHSA